MKLDKITPEFLTLLLAILGIPIGYYFKDISINLAFIGQVFILLLKVLIVPLVMSSIFLAVTNLKLNDLKKLGSRTISYYLATSALACIVGLSIANLAGIGNIEGLSGYANYEETGIENFTLSSLLVSFFSGNIIKSLAEGNIIQLIVFTFIFAFGTLSLKEENRLPLVGLANSIQEVIMNLIKWIITFIAPIGVFSLVANLVAQTDFKIFMGFGPLFTAILIAMVIHVCLTLPTIAYFIGRFNPLRFVFQVKEALVVALTTASSAATLPISMRVVKDNAGVKEKTSDFILPIGATLNMDGSALYQGIVILFLAEMAGISLDLSQQILVFFFVMMSSAGTAGVPNGGIIMMGAIMGMLGIPLEYLGIYLLIDRIWDYPVTMVNVFSDLIGAKTVDRFTH